MIWQQGAALDTCAMTSGRRGVLFGPDAPFIIAAGCTALRAWDLRCCQLTLRQMNRLMRALPDVAMMSSGQPLFVLREDSLMLFEGGEVPPRSMSFRLRMEALVRRLGCSRICALLDVYSPSLHSLRTCYKISLKLCVCTHTRHSADAWVGDIL